MSAKHVLVDMRFLKSDLVSMESNVGVASFRRELVPKLQLFTEGYDTAVYVEYIRALWCKTPIMNTLNYSTDGWNQPPPYNSVFIDEIQMNQPVGVKPDNPSSSFTDFMNPEKQKDVFIVPSETRYTGAFTMVSNQHRENVLSPPLYVGQVREEFKRNLSYLTFRFTDTHAKFPFETDGSALFVGHRFIIKLAFVQVPTPERSVFETHKGVLVEHSWDSGDYPQSSRKVGLWRSADWGQTNTLDGASGGIYFAYDDLSVSMGRITSWKAQWGATGRYVTPALVKMDGTGSTTKYTIKGIGTSRTVGSTGTYTFDFGLQLGTDVMESGGYVLALIDRRLVWGGSSWTTHTLNAGSVYFNLTTYWSWTFIQTGVYSLTHHLNQSDGGIGTTVGGVSGVEIPLGASVVTNPNEASRTYSTVYGNDSIGTGHARSMLDSAQAWSTASNSVGQWMRIDLNTETVVYGVQTQGRNGSNQWVTSYKLYYSNDDVTYQEIDSGRTFTGNTDQSTKVTQYLNTVINARYIKFHILAWSGWISMRAGVITTSYGAPSVARSYLCEWYYTISNGVNPGVPWDIFDYPIMSKTLDPVIEVGKRCRVELRMFSLRNVRIKPKPDGGSWGGGDGTILYDNYEPFYAISSPQIKCPSSRNTFRDDILPSGMTYLTSGVPNINQAEPNELIIQVDPSLIGRPFYWDRTYTVYYGPPKFWGYVSETVGPRLGKLDISIAVDRSMGYASPFYNGTMQNAYMGIKLVFTVEEW